MHSFRRRVLQASLATMALPAWVAAGTAAATAAATRLLVIVDTLNAPWSVLFLDGLKAALRARYPNAELDVESWPAEPGAESPATVPPAWLRQKYAGRPCDIVLPLSPSLVMGAVALRDALWPAATVVVPVATASVREALHGVARTVGLTPPDFQRETLALIFRLLPRTRQVAVAVSSLDTDPLRGNWRRSLEILHGRAGLIDLSGLTFPALQERVASLPPATALYFAAPGVPSGRIASPRDLFRSLVERANAPIFVDAATLLEMGAVGGAVVSPEGLARDVGRQIDAILGGTPVERIGFMPQSPARTTVDWPAMQRWQIPIDRVPEGSEVLRQPPGLWTAYRGPVIAGGAVVSVQTLLIAALVSERRRRRRAEEQTQYHLANLARLNRGAALGALSAALAHEISQPLGAILSNAETAELLLDAPGGAPVDALRELVVAIREDDLRAAAVLTRLRAWIANAPSSPRAIGLNAIVDDVSRMLSVELKMRETELQLVLAPDLPSVSADAVQLQQVLLNLMLNALEALQAVVDRPRRIVVTTRWAAHEVMVSVRDNGTGLADAVPEELFQPFYSTKPRGLGVGLAISRSIVERHGGRLGVASDGPGVCFHFTLPVSREAAATSTQPGVTTSTSTTPSLG